MSIKPERARRYGPLLAAGLVMAGSARADYLPQAGPAPLRLQALAQPARPRPALPPITVPDSTPTSPSATSGRPASLPAEHPWPANTAALPDWWTAFWEGLAAEGTIGPFDAGTPLRASDQRLPTFDARLTPQMLLRFFNRQAGATNNLDAAVVVPPSYFQPPTSAGGASSSATYTTP
jgi:hypothetical protein